VARERTAEAVKRVARARYEAKRPARWTSRYPRSAVKVEVKMWASVSASRRAHSRAVARAARGRDLTPKAGGRRVRTR